MAGILDKDVSRHQSFHRRLLSEYDTTITLEHYIDYFDLKKLAKKIENTVAKLSGFKDAQTQKKVRRSGSALLLLQDRDFDDREEVSSCSLSSTMCKMGAPRRCSLLKEGSPSKPNVPLSPHPVGLAAALSCSGPQDSALLEERQTLQTEFFVRLNQTFKKVCQYLAGMEKKMQLQLAEMRQLTERMIQQHRNQYYLQEIYVQLQAIDRFRSLNLIALQRIFYKFLTRCAHDSLSLQGKVAQLNERVQRSGLVRPSIDLRGFLLEVISVYGIVHRLTYETAIEQLRQYEARVGANTSRIVAPSETFFFNNVLPLQKSSGAFAIKIFAGSSAELMEKMLTQVLRCPRSGNDSNICSLFPNGEVRLDLSKPVRGDDVFIVQSTEHCRRNGLTMNGSLMELALLIHSACLAGAQRITAVLPYLGYTRDTVSIAAIAEIIELMGCHQIITVDLDSEQVEGCFTIPMEIVSAKMEFVRYIAKQLKSEGNDFTEITIVAPRDLYLRRAKEFADALMREEGLHTESQFVSVCTAVRRQNLGEEDEDEDEDSPNGVLSARTEEEKRLSQKEFPHIASPGPQHNTAVFETPSSSPHLPLLEHDQVRASASSFDARSDMLSSPLFRDRNVTTSGIEHALAVNERGQRAIIRRKKHDMMTVADCEDDERSMENIRLVGDVKNRLCVIVDTMIDEAVDIAAVSRCLSRNGAKRVLVVATHPIFSGRAVERIKNSPVDLVIVSDSINQDEYMKDPKLAKKLRIVPISPLLALAIEKIHTESKLSMLL